MAWSGRLSLLLSLRLSLDSDKEGFFYIGRYKLALKGILCGLVAPPICQHLQHAMYVVVVVRVLLLILPLFHKSIF